MMTPASMDVYLEQLRQGLSTYTRRRDEGQIEPTEKTRLCVAISNLDLARVKELVEEGERLDIQVRPYKTLYMNCPLTLAYQARIAAEELADEKDWEVSMALDMLRERRLQMFAFVLEQNPKLWIETYYNDTPIGLHSCFGDPDFETLFRSFEKKISLNKLQG